MISEYGCKFSADLAVISLSLPAIPIWLGSGNRQNYIRVVSMLVMYGISMLQITGWIPGIVEHKESEFVLTEYFWAYSVLKCYINCQ